MNLDLENPSPFWSIIKEDQVSCEQVLKLCRDNEYYVSSISACGNLPDALSSAINQFQQNARREIRMISAYYGCRVFDESNYKSIGVRRLDLDEIIDWCKVFFSSRLRG